MNEPRAVEISPSIPHQGEWVVTGYWDGKNRAGDDVTFATKQQAYKFASEEGFIVCTRPQKKAS